MQADLDVIVREGPSALALCRIFGFAAAPPNRARAVVEAWAGRARERGFVIMTESAKVLNSAPPSSLHPSYAVRFTLVDVLDE